MKKIVRKSHEKEIAYKLSKKVAQTKLGGGYFSPPVQIGLTIKQVPTLGQFTVDKLKLQGYCSKGPRDG